MKKTIEEIGVINIETLKVVEGRIEMRVPIEVISEHLDMKLDYFFERYKEDNPQVNYENIVYDASLVFQFGTADPEFSLTIIVFDKDYKGNDEFYDELKVTLSDEARKQFRKIAWEKLGEALFDL